MRNDAGSVGLCFGLVTGMFECLNMAVYWVCLELGSSQFDLLQEEK